MLKDEIEKVLEELSTDSFNATILKREIKDGNIPYYLKERTSQALTRILELVEKEKGEKTIKPIKPMKPIIIKGRR